MSMAARREYLSVVRARYRALASRAAKAALLDEVIGTLGYNRKYAIRVLGQPNAGRRSPVKRRGAHRYLAALPAIELVWTALDYPCAERLHPVLLSMAEQLAAHGEISLPPDVRAQLASISRATLARRLATMPSPKARRYTTSRGSVGLRSEIPLGRYDWDESRPGALAVDLVEHNGGSVSGHYLCTLTVVDVVSGWSRRRGILSRGQRPVHGALTWIIAQWPHPTWGLHSDNGSEFLSNHLSRFVRDTQIQFTRSRPYRKNDNPHAEQKNRQFVREMVGYDRFETAQQLAWLNDVYDLLDPYANLLLPSRKLIGKTRVGAHIQKRYDQARSPFQRLCDLHALSHETQQLLETTRANLNPLALHQRLAFLLCSPPAAALATPAD
ncbi:MAG TPA: transposase [Bacillota bacterium]|nr:transposase [Bacillota bacterium]